LHSNEISKFLRQITHFSFTGCTLGQFGIVVIGQVGMKNKPKLCKSCEKRNEDCEAWSLLQVFGDICNKKVTQKGWF
jgi:hypothetical protein